MAETAVVTILFCDLVGSTELLHSLGDDANDEVRRSLLGIFGRSADAYGGKVVKSAGDGAMVAFRRSAADAVSCAVAMQRAVTRIEHDGAAIGLELRVGISSGEASHEDGDWFGTPVVEAARLEAAARPGQILVSDVVRTIVGTRGGARFSDAGKRAFKGFPRPVPVVEVVWRTDDDPPPRPRPKTRKRHTGVLIACAAVVALVAAAAIAATVVLRDSDNSDQVVASGLPLAAEGYTPLLEGDLCDPEWEFSPEIMCEELVVPENRQKPDGRQLRIMMITYPSRGATGNPPTITLGGFEDNFEESDARQYGDFISFDIRGGSLSNPVLTCPELISIQRVTFALAQEEADPVWLAASKRCGDRLVAEGRDLNQYGLDDIVTDVRDLVIAKGWQQINLQGNGDWARIAVLFAQRYPQVVRAVVIADPLPHYAPQDDMIVHVNAALEAYFDACDADEDCGRAFPGVRERPRQIYEQYEAQPVLVSVPDPDGGEPYKVLLDGDALMWALASALNSQGAVSVGAASLMSLDSEATRLTAASFLVDNAARDPLTPFGLWNSFYCEDIAPVLSRTSIESGASIYPHLRGLSRFIDTCGNWPTAADSVLWDEIKVSPVPALILSGELSPWFPPAYAERAAEAFADPTIVVLTNLTGSPISSGPQCVSDLRLAFLRDPHAELDIDACLEKIPPIEFLGT